MSDFIDLMNELEGSRILVRKLSSFGLDLSKFRHIEAATDDDQIVMFATLARILGACSLRSNAEQSHVVTAISSVPS